LPLRVNPVFQASAFAADPHGAGIALLAIDGFEALQAVVWVDLRRLVDDHRAAQVARDVMRVQAALRAAHAPFVTEHGGCIRRTLCVDSPAVDQRAGGFRRPPELIKQRQRAAVRRAGISRYRSGADGDGDGHGSHGWR